MVVDQFAATAGEDGWPAGETRPLLLAAVGGGSFNAAAVRGHGPADRVAALALRVESETGRRKPGETNRGEGEVSEKSRGQRVRVPVDPILKAHTWLPDGTLATGVRNCGRERAGGCILTGFRMPKWKSWFHCL